MQFKVGDTVKKEDPHQWETSSNYILGKIVDIHKKLCLVDWICEVREYDEWETLRYSKPTQSTTFSTVRGMSLYTISFNEIFEINKQLSNEEEPPW